MKFSNQMNYLETPNEILTAHSYRLFRKSAIIKATVFLILFATVLAILLLLFSIAKVNRTSMEPTFHSGDIVLIKKNCKEYKAGDIIVFRTQTGQKNVKRIVAVSGDTVDISDYGKLIVNKEEKEEPYIYTDTFKKSSGIEYPVKIKKEAVFVLGDNRISSIDSRDTGAISTKKIIGKVLLSIEMAK